MCCYKKEYLLIRYPRPRQHKTRSMMNSLMSTLAHLDWDILSQKDKARLKLANFRAQNEAGNDNSVEHLYLQAKAQPSSHSR